MALAHSRLTAQGQISVPAEVRREIRSGAIGHDGQSNPHAVGAAVYEEYVYGEDGSFRTGTFADYLVPTTTEVPAPLILHFESPSPFTPLGAKGVGEGGAIPGPAAVANAVEDALATSVGSSASA